ncbi:MAG: non-homologous end-joining DNA ligase [Dehalogenimonas sp.]
MPPAKRNRKPDLPTTEMPDGAVEAPVPRSISPMLAQLGREPPQGDEWIFEPKLDGFRTLAFIDHGKVILRSRNDTDMSRYFPAIVTGLSSLKQSSVVFDGEIVAIDEKGKTCFQCLQQLVGLPHQHTGKQFSTVYYVFDVLYLNGFDLTGVVWDKRHAILKQILSPGPNLRLVSDFEGDGAKIFHASVDAGMEGIVAKKRMGLYLAGKRSSEWIKVKHTQSEEFVIGGFARGYGKRSENFASLLLGYYDKGKLIYAGSVGTGFDGSTLREIEARLKPLVTDKPPFSAVFEYAEGVTWVKPRLIAEVKFAEWTPGGLLRHAVFLRLRGDKAAKDIIRSQVEVPSPFSGSSTVELSGSTRQILEALQNLDDDVRVKSENHEVSLIRMNKVLWPEYRGRKALTKRDYIRYLVEVAPYILPHLKDRPLTLTRYPNGILEDKFYQKHWETVLPEFVETVSIFSKENEAFQDYLLCNNLATLIWLGQLADLEIHTWYSRVGLRPDRPDISRYTESPEHLGDYLAGIPDFVVFDIDPYIYSGEEAAGGEPELNQDAFKAAVETAFWVKEAVESVGLTPFIKISGKTGLHLFTPIRRQFNYDVTRDFAGEISRLVESQHPSKTTTEWAVAKRRGKIFLDFRQNVRGKTVASVYSARPTPWAGVSLPVRWEELEHIYPGDFNILNVPPRLASVGDVWADIMEFKKPLKTEVVPGKDSS